jgi:hypothetical protein
MVLSKDRRHEAADESSFTLRVYVELPPPTPPPPDGPFEEPLPVRAGRRGPRAGL